MESLLSMSAGGNGGMVDGPGGAGRGFLTCGASAAAVPIMVEQSKAKANARLRRGITGAS
jgi:hypothetical protein